MHHEKGVRSGSDSDPDPSDEELMERIRENESDALQLLMERHWPGLLRYATRMLGGAGDEADDVGQEVFIRVWEHRARWSTEGSAQGYLYRIARNLVHMRQRRQAVRERKRPEVEREGASPSVFTPVDHTSHEELRTAFECALKSLPERRQEAFTLVRLQGLSIKEAAQAMDVTPRTVTNHVYMAARELEKRLHRFLS